MVPRERISASQWLAPWLRHQHVERYVWAAQFCRSGRIVDAACANGYGAAMLAGAGARCVVGVDISWEPIVEASLLGGRPPLLLGDGTKMPFRSGAFDTFVSFETIEHVADDETFVTEVRRVLRAGGTYLCSTPNRKLVNPGNSIVDRPFNPFHVREYTRDELETLLCGSFSSIEWFGQRSYERSYTALLRWIGRLAPRVAVRAHQLRKLAGLPLEGARKHRPFALPSSVDAEVLIAVCR
jgi:SAM-dependent methyltransferase